MRSNFVFAVILALVLSAACSKPETAVHETEPAKPAPVTSQAPIDTAAPAATEPVAETPPSPMSDEMAPTAAPEATTPAAPSTLTSQPPTQAPPAQDPQPATTAKPEPASPVEPPVEAPAASTPEELGRTTPATTTSTRKVPKTHTVDHGGTLHAAGAENAAQKCSVCHGKELKGGKAAKVSCFECHEKNWK